MSEQTLPSKGRRAGACWLAALAVLPLFLALLLSSVYFFATYQPFYEREYDKYSNAQIIGTDRQTLSTITRAVIDYLAGRRETLDMQASIHGQEREVFTEREKMHMVDVLYLFDLLRIAWLASVALFAVLLLLAWLTASKQRRLFCTSKGFLIGSCVLLALFGCLAAYIVSDFNRAFLLFHQLSFTNDLWTLDPRTDVLIQMVPLNFFVDISTAIAITFAAAFALVTVLALVVFLCTRKEKPAPLQPQEQELPKPAVQPVQVPKRPSADDIIKDMGISEKNELPQSLEELLKVGPSPLKSVEGKETPSAQQLRQRLERL